MIDEFFFACNMIRDSDRGRSSDCRQGVDIHSVIVVDALPAGPTGKPDRRALRAAAGGLTSAAAPSAAAPRPESRTSSPDRCQSK